MPVKMRIIGAKRDFEEKKKSSKPAWLLDFLAEAVGFEPTSPCGLPDFELFEGKFL